MERVLAGGVVEPGLPAVAVAHGAAAGEHARRRGHLLRGEIVVVVVVVGRGLLEAVGVSESVSVRGQRVGGLVAAEAGGGGRGRGLAEGEGGARAA